MKKIIFLLAICFAEKTYSQVSAFGLGKELNAIKGFGRVQTGFEGFQTYKSGNVNGSQFFNDNWSSGSVTTVNREVISKDYLFLYDKVRQELFLKPKDTLVVVLADKSQITSFTINSDKPHIFNQAYLYVPEQKGDFFEVLIQNDNYTLLKLIKTTFEKANTADMEKVKQGNFNDEFIDHISYYLFNNNKAQKIKLNENSLRKALKNNEPKVNDFFDLHQNNDFTEQLLISLINQVNS